MADGWTGGRSKQAGMAALARLIVLTSQFLPASVHALDHDNLDPNRPIAIEDAYAIAEGEIALEAGMVFNDRRRGPTRVGFQPQIIYGAFANTQIEVMTGLFSEPRTIVSDDRSGDLSLGVLYNLNTETTMLPAFAVRLGVGFPTGVNSQGLDSEVTGVMTRTLGRWRAHLNAGYRVLGSPRHNERAGAYRMVTAVSYPLGYPTRFRETVIANVFTRQSDLVGQPNPTGVAIGIRHQASPRVVLDAGMGTELLGPADRSVLFGTVGVSVAF